MECRTIVGEKSRTYSRIDPLQKSQRRRAKETKDLGQVSGAAISISSAIYAIEKIDFSE
jgi:hypothetical protein